jgi:hypothetical protein
MKVPFTNQAMPETRSSPVLPRQSLVHLKCPCGGNPGLRGECAECGRERFLGNKQPILLPKLTVNQPGDRYEREADRIAEQVIRLPDEEALHRAPPPVQRVASADVNPQTELLTRDEEHPLPVDKATGAASEVTGEVAATIAALPGTGRPLAASELSFFEPRFGHDFSQVRVHTDARATAAARALRARAFTVGRELVFSAGQYAPETSAGRELLAHELTHVVQQGATAVRGNHVRDNSSPLTAETINTKSPANIQRSYGTVRNEQGGRRTQPAPNVTITEETKRLPDEEDQVAPPPVGAEPGGRPPDIQRADETSAPARPSLTLTPGAALTRGDSLTATLSFTPAAGERINVTSWEYITPSHGNVGRPATDADFQTQWAGTMALSGTIRLRWHYLPRDTLVETLEQPVTVSDRTGAPWASAVVDDAETARAGMPSPPRQFEQLGVHNANVTDATTTDSTVNDGPNQGFTFVSALTAGSYTSSPQIHPDVTNANSAFRRFHRDGSVLFKVPVAGGAKTRIPVAEYSNLVENPLSWDVPDWEAFYKRHAIYTVEATSGGTTRTVADADWGLASNASDAAVQITNDAGVRAQLGIGPGDSYSVVVTVAFAWEGYALMASADIPNGVRSHEFGHDTHSHRANFHKMLRAVDPQKVIERTVSTPSNTADFAAKLEDLRTEIMAPYHEIVDEAESARQVRFVAVAGETMAGINTNPDTGDFLGNVWDITGNAPMT